jgi:hypothetical protein
VTGPKDEGPKSQVDGPDAGAVDTAVGVLVAVREGDAGTVGVGVARAVLATGGAALGSPWPGTAAQPVMLSSSAANPMVRAAVRCVVM